MYRVIAERRDVRRGFRPDPVPADVLGRVLAAAHQAPSVGFSQPWDFIVITDRARRERIAALARRHSGEFAADLPGARARAFDQLKIESILDTPVNIVVSCDRTRGGRHTLGRHIQPQTAEFSSVLAVANLWLAARAEGLGVGWVSFFDERELAAELGLPAHLEVIAYLCVGYVTAFAPEPELADGRLGASPAGVLGGARRGVRPPRNARGGTSGPARRRDRRDHPARRRGDGRRAGTAGPDDQAARLARRARGGVRAAGRAGGQLPAAAARAGLRRGVRRRPRRARAGGQPVAAGGDRPDGRQLPGRRGGGQRVRGPGRGRGHGGRRGGGRRPRAGPRAAAPQDRARHRGLHRGTRDDPRPGDGRASDRRRDRPGPGRGGQPVPGHRRHGHRQHHRVRRADLRLHRSRPGRGDRPRHRDRRGHLRAEDRGGLPRPGQAPARPGRPGGRPGGVRRLRARRPGRVHPRRRRAARAGDPGRGHRGRRRAGRGGPGPRRDRRLLRRSPQCRARPCGYA